MHIVTTSAPANTHNRNYHTMHFSTYHYNHHIYFHISVWLTIKKQNELSSHQNEEDVAEQKRKDTSNNFECSLKHLKWPIVLIYFNGI